MQKFSLDFILHAPSASAQSIKSSLAEFASVKDFSLLPSIEAGRSGDFKITLSTEEPTLVFDVCSQFGRIREIKVEEIKGEAL